MLTHSFLRSLGVTSETSSRMGQRYRPVHLLRAMVEQSGRCESEHSTAWRGRAGQSMTRPGKAGQAVATQAWALRGMAWLVTAQEGVLAGAPSSYPLKKGAPVASIKFRMSFSGTRPLIMHNAIHLADPLSAISKEISNITAKGKKGMTDDDYEVKAKLQHRGGLYIDEELGPYLPAENIERCFKDAGGLLQGLGRKTQRGMCLDEDMFPLRYKGPRDAEGLWENKTFVFGKLVKIGAARVMAYRPIFPRWECEVSGAIDSSELSLDDLMRVAECAATRVGICDYRPRYGRFEVEVEKV